MQTQSHSEELTIRGIVHRIQVELRSGEVAPSRARELLMTLTSLLGNCSTELTQREAAYTKVLAGFLDTELKANRAKIRAQLSPEYEARQEAKNTHALVVEMIRSLRQIMRSSDEEMRLQK